MALPPVSSSSKFAPLRVAVTDEVILAMVIFFTEGFRLTVIYFLKCCVLFMRKMRSIILPRCIQIESGGGAGRHSVSIEQKKSSDGMRIVFSKEI